MWEGRAQSRRRCGRGEAQWRVPATAVALLRAPTSALPATADRPAATGVRHWAHPAHICAGTGLAPAATGARRWALPAMSARAGLDPATSAPCPGSCDPATSATRLGSPLSHLHRDWAHPGKFCTASGLAPATSVPRLGSPRPHLRRDWARLLPHLRRDRSPHPHLRRDWAGHWAVVSDRTASSRRKSSGTSVRARHARKAQSEPGTGLTPPTSAPGTGLAPATSAPGLGPARPHLHRD
jgi:hypothetical protein